MSLDKKPSIADIIRDGESVRAGRKRRGNLLQLVRRTIGQLQEIERQLQHGFPQDGSNAPPE